MIIQYRLKVGSGDPKVLTKEDVKNWDDLTYSLKRKEYGGIIRAFTSKFEFIGDAYDMLLSEWLTNLTNSKARVFVSVMNNTWEYDDLFSADLDFMTFKYTMTTVSISAVDNAVSAVLKSKGGTSFDLSITDSRTLLKVDKAMPQAVDEYYYTQLESDTQTDADYGKFIEVCACHPTTGTNKLWGALAQLPLQRSSGYLKVVSAVSHISTDYALASGANALNFHGEGNILNSVFEPVCYFGETEGSIRSGYTKRDNDDCATVRVRMNCAMYCHYTEESATSWSPSADVSSRVRVRKYSYSGASVAIHPTLYLCRGTLSDDTTQYNVECIAAAKVTEQNPSAAYGLSVINVNFDEVVTLMPGEYVFLVLGVPQMWLDTDNMTAATSFPKLWIHLTGNQYRSSIDRFRDTDIYCKEGMRMSIIGYDSSDYSDYPLHRTFYAPGVTLESVLNKMLFKMFYDAGYMKVTGSIEHDDDVRIKNCLLFPDNLFKGNVNAKITTSYNDFVKFMEYVFGMVPEVDDINRTVTFRKRGLMYAPTRQEEVDGETVSVPNIIKGVSIINRDFSGGAIKDLMYSTIEIGYDVDEYDSRAGEQEYHKKATYTTGCDYNEKKLDMISPYRTDPWGIEYLCAKLGEKDNEACSKVYAVCVTNCVKISTVDSRYSTDTEWYTCDPLRAGYVVTGTADAATTYNAMYSPRNMVESNKDYLSIFSALLKFTSSTAATNVSINSQAEQEDVTLSSSDRIFAPMEVEITTAELDIPSVWNGLVEFTVDGRTYRGFINEVEIHVSRQEAVTYKLLCYEYITEEE